MPSKKMLGYLVRHTDGVTKMMSAEDVAALSIASAKVGDAWVFNGNHYLYKIIFRIEMLAFHSKQSVRNRFCKPKGWQK